MTYIPQTWENGPGGGTPINAARLTYMEEGIVDADAGGGGWGTVVVYAADALNPSGNYICTGTDDQEVIQAALEAVGDYDLENGQGTVCLSEGTFNLSAPILWGGESMSAWYNVWLVGSNGGTYASFSQGSVLLGAGTVIDASTQGGSVNLRNLSIQAAADGPYDLILAGNDLHMDYCYVWASTNNASPARAIVSSGGGATIEVMDCVVLANGACITIVEGAFFTAIHDNYLYNGGDTDYCIEMHGDGIDSGPLDSTLFQICRNKSDGNAFGVLRCSDWATAGIVSDNIWWYDTGTCITLENCTGITLRGNSMGDGDHTDGMILLDGCRNCTVSDNYLFYGPADGIVLTDSSDNIVTGNMVVDLGVDTDDTFSGIHLTGDSNDNMIYGNKVTKDPTVAEANLLQYGIRIEDATCDTNIVYGNDVKGSYATTGFFDAGTGTVTTAGNRT